MIREPHDMVGWMYLATASPSTSCYSHCDRPPDCYSHPRPALSSSLFCIEFGIVWAGICSPSCIHLLQPPLPRLLLLPLSQFPQLPLLLLLVVHLVCGVQDGSQLAHHLHERATAAGAAVLAMYRKLRSTARGVGSRKRGTHKTAGDSRRALPRLPRARSSELLIKHTAGRRT